MWLTDSSSCLRDSIMSISPPHVLHRALTVVVNGNPPPPFTLFLQTITLTTTTGQMKVLRCDQARRFLTCCFSGSSAHSEDAKIRSYHNQSILKSLHLLMTSQSTGLVKPFLRPSDWTNTSRHWKHPAESQTAALRLQEVGALHFLPPDKQRLCPHQRQLKASVTLRRSR